jgi:hypothetical protein
MASASNHDLYQAAIGAARAARPFIRAVFFQEKRRTAVILDASTVLGACLQYAMSGGVAPITRDWTKLLATALPNYGLARTVATLSMQQSISDEIPASGRSRS